MFYEKAISNLSYCQMMENNTTIIRKYKTQQKVTRVMPAWVVTRGWKEESILIRNVFSHVDVSTRTLFVWSWISMFIMFMLQVLVLNFILAILYFEIVMC